MKKTVYLSTTILLLIAVVVMWLPWLGETLFYSKGEPREAIVAVSMLQSGDWILPVSAGSDIPYKPPFLAWLIAAAAWLFNGGAVNEFLSRLPSVVAAIALVMATYTWARRIRGERFALYMALILACSVEFFRDAIACRVDMVLTACMVGAMYMLYDLRERGGAWWRYACVVLLLSGAICTKGPVGALLPCLAVGLYQLLHGDRFWSTLGKLSLICVLSFILPGVWYYLAWRQGGDGFLYTMWEENIMRLIGTMPYESHVRPFWYNFNTILLGMLPWTLLAAVAMVAWRRYQRRALRSAGLFALVSALTVILFYCIPSSKRSVYLLPAYPFIAYAVASIVEGLAATRITRYYSIGLAWLAIVVPVVMAVTRFYPIAGYDIAPTSWWGWLLLLLPIATSAIWLTSNKKEAPFDGACIAMCSLLTLYSAVIMPAVLNPMSDLPEARRIEALAGDKPIYIVGEDPHYAIAFNINFYLNDRLRRLPHAADADTVAPGTVMLFSVDTDTVGLPADCPVRVLKQRFSDTRRPAFIAVKMDTLTPDADFWETTP